MKLLLQIINLDVEISSLGLKKMEKKDWVVLVYFN